MWSTFTVLKVSSKLALYVFLKQTAALYFFIVVFSAMFRKVILESEWNPNKFLFKCSHRFEIYIFSAFPSSPRLALIIRGHQMIFSQLLCMLQFVLNCNILEPKFVWWRTSYRNFVAAASWIWCLPHFVRVICKSVAIVICREHQLNNSSFDGHHWIVVNIHQQVSFFNVIYWIKFVYQESCYTVLVKFEDWNVGYFAVCIKELHSEIPVVNETLNGLGFFSIPVKYFWRRKR